MTPTDRRPAELDDLDRYVGQTVADDDLERMEAQWVRVLNERMAAQVRAQAAEHAERDRRATARRLTRLAVVWFVGCLLFAGIAFYLQAHGE